MTLTRARARSTAPPSHLDPRPPTPPRHTATHSHADGPMAWSLMLCNRQGHRANINRAQLSMAKVCRAPGSRDAKHTEANSAALRDRLPVGEGWAYGNDTRWARSINADMAYTVSVLTDSVSVFRTGEKPKVKERKMAALCRSARCVRGSRSVPSCGLSALCNP